MFRSSALVYDNAKSGRLGHHQLISEHTAALITGQKLAVRERSPLPRPGGSRCRPDAATWPGVGRSPRRI